MGTDTAAVILDQRDPLTVFSLSLWDYVKLCCHYVAATTYYTLPNTTTVTVWGINRFQSGIQNENTLTLTKVGFHTT